MVKSRNCIKIVSKKKEKISVTFKTVQIFSGIIRVGTHIPENIMKNVALNLKYK